MSRFSPSVAPESYVGDVGGQIAQALHDRQMLNYARDKDAYETGFGATPVNENEAPSGFGSTVRHALSKVGIGSDPQQDYVNQIKPQMNAGIAGNAQANNQAINQRFNPLQGTNWNPEAPNPMGGVNTPGAFNPMLGGFTPARQTRLPSGAVVNTMDTPYGMQRAMLPMKMQQMGAEYGKTIADTNAANAGAYKSTREANAPHLGDAGYAGALGEVKGAEANAALPAELQRLVMSGAISRETALAVANVTQAGENARQGNQQVFTAGENVKNRQATAQDQAVAQGASLTNRLQEIKQTQAGQILPSLLGAGKRFLQMPQLRVPGTSAPQTGRQPITSAEAAQLKRLGHTDQDISTNYEITDGH